MPSRRVCDRRSLARRITVVISSCHWGAAKRRRRKKEMQALAGKRRVDGDGGIGECVEALLADCLIGGRRLVLVGRVDADAGIASHYAEQALIVKSVE